MTCKKVPETQQILQCVNNGKLLIKVEAVNVFDLDSYDFKLIYDTNYLEPVENEINEGPFLKSLGGTTFFLKDLSKPGIIWLSGSLVGENRAIAPDGTGDLVLLGFEVIKPLNAESQLLDLFQIKKASLWDSEVNKDKL